MDSFSDPVDLGAQGVRLAAAASMRDERSSSSLRSALQHGVW